jgi:glucose-fructose oxidoreductase
MLSRHRFLSLLFVFALFVTTSLSAQLAVVPGPVRVAIVGLEHGHVDGFLSALKQNYFNEVQLVAVSDPDPALMAKYQKKYGWPDYLIFHSEAEMIDKIKPQAILVYTPVGGHRAAIEIAAKRGVSVMVEKPLTISMDDARAIRATAEANHIQMLVNYETTWYPSNRAAYDEVRNGSLGAIRRIVVHDGHQGPAEIGVQPEFLKWLTDPVQNGAGAMYDFGCYGADLATWLMHGQAPLTVTAVANHDKPDKYPRVDDDATIVLQYPQAQVVIMASWNWPFGRKDMEVYGATGYAITVGADHLRTRLEHDSEDQLQSAGSLPDAEKDSISYLRAVLNGKIIPRGDLTSLDTNMVVMQILDAARESVRTGRTISLNSAAQ